MGAQLNFAVKRSKVNLPPPFEQTWKSPLRYIPRIGLEAFSVLEKKIFKSLCHGHGGHLIRLGGTIRTNCQYSFDRRPRVKSGEIAHAVSEREKKYTFLFMYIAQG